MILQPFNFNPAAIMREIEHMHAWDRSPRITHEGSVHVDTFDTILRGPINAGIDSLPQLHQQVECEDYAISAFPDTRELVDDIYRHAKGTKLGRVILAKLPPGKVVFPHADEGRVPETYIRYHAIVQSGFGSWFLAGREATNMITGQVWIVDVSQVHAVVNLSDEDRIHLIVDIL